MTGKGLTAVDPFKTINYALQQLIYLRPTQEIEAIILISPGTYNENLVIKTDKVSLKKKDGSTGDVIIDGGGQDVIQIDGAKKAVIDGVTVQNGEEGIVSIYGSTFDIVNTIVRSCAGNGFIISGTSAAVMTDCNISDSGISGILVSRNSHLTLTGTIVCSGNGRDGLVVSQAANVAISQANFTANNNDRYGIVVNDSSNGYLGSSTVNAKNNGWDGIGIFESSNLEIWLNNTITLEQNGRRGISIGESSNIFSENSTITSNNNAFDGIGIFGSSNLSISGGTNLILEQNGDSGLKVIGSTASNYRNSAISSKNNSRFGILVAQNASFDNYATLTIENNANIGLQIYNSAHVEINSPSAVSVTGNSGPGFYIGNGSVLNAWGGSLLVEYNSGDGIEMVRASKIRLGPLSSSIQIRNNNGRGIFADDGSTAECTDATITGNTPNDVVLSFGSRASLYGGTIGTISCDGTALSRGDHLCPP